MRILQVHTSYRQPGGEDAVVQEERLLLSGAGHEVETHLVRNPQGDREALPLLLRAAWNRAAAAAVVDQAASFRADVVHVHNTWFALSPAVFAALSAAGFPTVVTMHNYRAACVNALLYRDQRPCQECVGRWPWRGIVHRCYRSSAAQSGAVAVTIATHRARGTWERDVDVVVALTDFAADVLARSGFPPERLVVKPNSVPDPGERSRPPSASRTLLFVGRMTEDKGILDLVGAWERHADAGFELVAVGDGPLLEAVRVKGVPGLEVVGPEPREAVAERMAAARALILPSRWYEGLPMVVLESMAAGLPLVIPDHGALPGIVGEGGSVFRNGDVSDLGRAIGEVFDAVNVDRLGAASRTRYLAEFSPEADLDRLEALYQRATEVRRGREA